MKSNAEAYADLIVALTGLVGRNMWIMWVILLLPLIPAFAFRSYITAFVVMLMLPVIFFVLPISPVAALWLWLAAMAISAIGGAFNLRYNQAERHLEKILAQLRAERAE